MKIIYEAGDPVRLTARRGLFRFIKYVHRDGIAHMFDAPTHAEVVDPRRETAAVVPVDQIQMPPASATPRDVQMHDGVHRLSTIAKETRRG